MMDLTFAPKGVLQMDDVRLVFKNFKGLGSAYNREGDRNFNVVIETQEQYEALLADVNRAGASWNVKAKPPREDGELPFYTLMVKVKFNERGPKAYLISGNSRTKLNEHTISILDDIDIASVRLDIRPFDGDIAGKPFRTAYLQGIEVIQEIDRFSEDLTEDDLRIYEADEDEE